MSRRCLRAAPLVLWTLTLTSTGCHLVFPFDVRTEQGDARAVDASVVDTGVVVDYDTALFGASYLVMVSDRPGQGGDDLYMALRPDPNSPFGTPVHLPSVSSALNESDPYFHAGLGLLIFFRSGDLHWSTVE